MTTLLSFRNMVRAFFSRYDYVVTPIGKMVLALIILLTLNKHTGYFQQLNNTFLVVGISLMCAFLPVEILAGIGGVFVVLHSFKVSIDVALVALSLTLIFYCAYMRFVPKMGIIVLLVPIFYATQMVYALPVVLGFLVGPAAIIPTIFGVVLYYYQIGLKDLANVLATSTEEAEAVQGYQYIISSLVNNKFMLLTFVVFTCVILITYIIYRMSFSNSWLVAFIVGATFNVVLFLVGSIVLQMDFRIIPIIIGSLISIVIALVVQFCKGMVDYQRTELLQFEDDNYYYYVKAIPKLSVSEVNKNIKHINSRTQN